MTPEALIRPAVPQDAALLAELRGVMQAANGTSTAEISGNLAIWEKWFAQALAAGEYVAWVAEVEGEGVSTIGLMFFPKFPSADDPFVQKPQVANVAVKPDFRQRGLAARLLDTALAWAREQGYQQVGLNAAPMGLELYRRAGFEVNAHPAMTLRLK